ncbi:unnamed protein product [Strongylus vulgaris]|uniref:ERAP1-like C-terminal domain-containing protein n=1 Tax=Strongylus vulgaris TaxID=40348 RepID=A0A3P7J711_STRVU|nr:unnamed protein product [Strongylus vulgaris]
MDILEQRVIEAYCSLGSEDCINKYKKLFDEEVVAKCQGTNAKASQCVTLAAPLRAKTYCYGVSEGGKAAYTKLKNLYMAENVAMEKDNLRRALGCHKDITALKEHVDADSNRSKFIICTMMPVHTAIEQVILASAAGIRTQQQVEQVSR